MKDSGDAGSNRHCLFDPADRPRKAAHAERADVRMFLGAALFNLGKPDEAIKEAKRALELDDPYGRAGRALNRRVEIAPAR